MQLQQLHEKEFIKAVIGKYAITARPDKFDDCVILDLSELCGVPNLPCLVYSLDHPSFIRRKLGEEEDHRFYGRWVAAIVCGDVLAMGAQPRGFALDLAAPLETETDRLEWMLQGIRDVLDLYGAAFEGGNFDTNALEMVGFAWGLVPKEKIIRRSGARVGDYVAVTGMLGMGWADWATRKLGLAGQLSEKTREVFVNYKRFPAAPVSAMFPAFAAGGITSGMDLSDGLIEFLYTIQERNGLGVTLKESWIPTCAEMNEAASLLNTRPALMALEGGYDTPLCHAWTVAPEAWPTLERIFSENGMNLFKLGVVTEATDILLESGYDSRPIPKFWDDQFRKESLIERWREAIKEL